MPDPWFLRMQAWDPTDVTDLVWDWRTYAQVARAGGIPPVMHAGFI
jgi:IMP dehydrogenase/GMP reductase